ncbi:MAG TPA: N-acetylneuraminate synthase family protein [Candidatus Sulfotelmatobacter sp.]|jgi:N-acetylneuraminate synthase/N,N'-diacetyllegionaminate synthase|nr:N-acetylneuraminate synthase family protein [Candidatus Sulfotelmatobacter sp.]
MDLAVRSIAAAAAAGVDAVKFQNYRTEDFLSDHTLTYSYVSQGQQLVESQYDMFKRCELTADSLIRLKRECDKQGVHFISTPTSEQGVDELIAVGADACKNGSDYLGHLPLIRRMAASAMPTILSTGMASLSDVDEAVDAFSSAGGKDLVLLHCVSAYPAPTAELNLRRILTLAQAFDVPVGFSDHSEGIIAATVAASLGCCMVEKHFTLDRSLPGPDHGMSSTPEELRLLVDGVRQAQAALGTAALGPVGAEIESRTSFRLSCVALRDLPAGTRLRAEDLAFRRPGSGFRPALAPLLVGRTIRRDLPRGHVLVHEDFDA